MTHHVWVSGDSTNGSKKQNFSTTNPRGGKQISLTLSSIITRETQWIFMASTIPRVSMARWGEDGVGLNGFYFHSVHFFWAVDCVWVTLSVWITCVKNLVATSHPMCSPSIQLEAALIPELLEWIISRSCVLTTVSQVVSLGRSVSVVAHVGLMHFFDFFVSCGLPLT